MLTSQMSPQGQMVLSLWGHLTGQQGEHCFFPLQQYIPRRYSYLCGVIWSMSIYPSMPPHTRFMIWQCVLCKLSYDLFVPWAGTAHESVLVRREGSSSSWECLFLPRLMSSTFVFTFQCAPVLHSCKRVVEYEPRLHSVPSPLWISQAQGKAH